MSDLIRDNLRFHDVAHKYCPKAQTHSSHSSGQTITGSIFIEYESRLFVLHSLFLPLLFSQNVRRFAWKQSSWSSAQTVTPGSSDQTISCKFLFHQGLLALALMVTGEIPALLMLIKPLLPLHHFYRSSVKTLSSVWTKSMQQPITAKWSAEQVTFKPC